MNRLQADVKDFHVAFDHPAPAFPVLELTEAVKDRLRARVAWLHEEATELEEALDEGDLVKVIDALGDSIYFAVGGYVVLGHDMDPYWKNIQDANMAKLGPDGKPIKDPVTDKVLKPEGWVAPEACHARVLKNLQHSSMVEGLARQLAFSRYMSDGNDEITFDRPISSKVLVEAFERARVIFDAGRDRAEALYAEMVKDTFDRQADGL